MNFSNVSGKAVETEDASNFLALLKEKKSVIISICSLILFASAVMVLILPSAEAETYCCGGYCGTSGIINGGGECSYTRELCVSDNKCPDVQCNDVVSCMVSCPDDYISGTGGTLYDYPDQCCGGCEPPSSQCAGDGGCLGDDSCCDDQMVERQCDSGSFGDTYDGFCCGTDGSWEELPSCGSDEVAYDSDDDGCDDSCNVLPVADAGSDKSVDVGESVSFDGGGSSDPDGSIESYNWDFGDGSTGSGETTTHSYSSAGDYTVELVVTDDLGSSDSDTLSVEVGVPPVADAGSDKTGFVGEKLQFKGTGSTDAEECPDGGVCGIEMLPEKGLARIDSEDVIHLVWNTGDGIYYRRSTEPLEHSEYGSWSNIIEITEGMTPPDHGEWRGYDLAIGPDDTVHVSWAGGTQTGTPIDDNDVYYANSSSDWNGQKFYGGEDDNELRAPDIEVGTDGVVHMAWYGWTPNAKMFYTNSSSGISNVKPLFHASDEKKLTDLELDQNNKPHIVWTRGSGGWPPSSADIYYASGYDWSAEKVFGPGDNRHASLNMDSNEVAHVFFQHETSYGSDIFYADSASNWEKETLVEDGSGVVSTVTGDDDQFLLWSSDKYGDPDVFWMNLSSKEVWAMVSNEHSQFGSDIFTDSDGNVFGLFRGNDTGSWESYLSELPGMRYKWYFGDGSTGSGAFASHVYSSSGVFDVMLEVIDSEGLSDTDNVTASIEAKPVADPDGPYTADVDESVSFDGSDSFDQDGSIETYSWDFGDGETGTGQETAHSYSSPGGYTANLTVTDNDGYSSSNSTQVSVIAYPVSDPNGPYFGDVDENVQFNATQSYAFDGVIQSYVWDFGDGTVYPDDLTGECSHQEEQCSFSSDVGNTRCNEGTPEECVEKEESDSYMCCGSTWGGAYECSECGYSAEYCLKRDMDPIECPTVEYDWIETDACGCTDLSAPVHSYDSTGNYTVTLNVTDDDGFTSTNQTTASIFGPPEAVFRPKDQSVQVDKAAFFDGSKSYSLSGGIVSYTWDFDDDGDSGSGETTTHTYDSNEIYQPSLTVEDESGANGSDSGVVTVFDPDAPTELHLETRLTDNQTEYGEIVNMEGIIRNTGQATNANVTFWKNCVDCSDAVLLDQEYRVVDSNESSYEKVSFGIKSERDSDYCIRAEGSPSTVQECQTLDVLNEKPFSELSVSPSEGSKGVEVTLDASESRAACGDDCVPVECGVDEVAVDTTGDGCADTCEAEPEGVGISNCEDLQNMNQDLSADYYLTQNIDCSDTVNWNDGAGFNPIGDPNNRFTGSFDGQEHNITGLHIYRSTKDYVGLFGYINNVEVKNVGLNDVKVTGDQHVGGLVGRNDGGSVNNSFATGNIEGSKEYVGGLIGDNNGPVSNSFAVGEVVGEGFVGGLIGSSYGFVDKSYAAVNTVGEENRVGGLVGFNSDLVFNSYATGNVKGSGKVGGLVGVNYWSDVNDSYSTGDVEGGFYVGCLVGIESEEDSVSSSFYNSDSSCNENELGTGKTTSEMQTESTFTDAGWDFENIWSIEEGVNDGYPYLTGVEGGSSDSSTETSSSGDCEIVSYEWDFDGDGEFTTTTEDPVRSHNYYSGGVFNPTVKVVDNNGLSDIDSEQIVVTGSDGIDLSTKIKHVSETSLNEGDLFSMTVKAANVGQDDLSEDTEVVVRDDENRTIQTISLSEENFTAGSSVEVSREWEIDETKEISIEIDPDDSISETDEWNNKDSIEVDVNSLPVANIKVEPSNYVELTEKEPEFHFSSEGSYDREENTIVSYSWDLGDGETRSDKEFSYSYVNEEKLYDVSLVVTDSDGATDTEETQIGVGIKPTFMLPDLYVQELDVPSTVTSNQSTDVTVSIKNIGNSRAGEFNVSVLAYEVNEAENKEAFDVTPVTGRAIGESLTSKIDKVDCGNSSYCFSDLKTVSGLDAGKSKTVSFDWKPEKPGEYEVFVETGGKGVQEMDANNNERSQMVSVQERPTVREVGGVPEYPVAALIAMMVIVAALGYLISSGKTIKES